MRLSFRPFALIAGALLASCSSPPPDPAVLAVQDFLTAVDRHDCAAVWSHFSEGSKAYVAAKSAEMIADTPYRDENLAPENLYCLQFLTYQMETAMLKSRSESVAIISVDRLEGDPKSYLIPGFWPTRYNVIHEDIRMVQEAGTWKVVVP